MQTSNASPDVDAILAELVGDAIGDDAKLRALYAGISQALELPVDVHVIGEPLSLVRVDYDGNVRRGLTALCRRGDGGDHRIALADVHVPTGHAAYPFLAAYRTWLGVAPASNEMVGATASGNARKHKAADGDIDLDKPADLVVLAVKQRVARCRLIGSDRVITLRAADLHRVVPGHIATVEPRKQWRHAGHPYLSGTILETRIEAAALGLVPLELHRFGDWDPSAEYWGEEGEPIEEWAKPIIARGPRPMFEMEQVLPGSDPDDFDSDPIIEANEIKDGGDTAGAIRILSKMLEADLRCLDAHAHLGNIEIDHSPRSAARHYEVGIRIGELSLGESFDGVLAWGLIDNRPFLRCMHGYGLCAWRLERWDEAERVFMRMLWLNPTDNQGVRFLLPAIRAREPWTEEGWG